MRDLQERRFVRHVLRSRALSVVLFVVVLLLVNSVYGIYKKDQVAKINRAESERRLAALKDKEVHLKTEIAKLKTDRGVEEELRSKFQITKAGEEVLIVVPDQTPTNSGNINEDSGRGLWGKFLRFIGL